MEVSLLVSCRPKLPHCEWILDGLQTYGLTLSKKEKKGLSVGSCCVLEWFFHY